MFLQQGSQEIEEEIVKYVVVPRTNDSYHTEGIV